MFHNMFHSPSDIAARVARQVYSLHGTRHWLGDISAVLADPRGDHIRPLVSPSRRGPR